MTSVLLNSPLFKALLLTFSLLSSAQAFSQSSTTLSKSLSEAQSMTEESKQSQLRINQSIAEREALEREYKALSEVLEETNINLLHQKSVHSVQQSKIKQLNAELSEISNTENSLIPMILNLIDWLDQHVKSDLPFYSNERLERIEQLKINAVNPDMSISQLYHSVLEAYQIENEYGYSIDTYKHKINLNEKEIEAQLLRVGRIALYYLSLDASHGGYWSLSNKQWKTVDASALKQISQGIKVASKQTPPSLLALPLEVMGN